MATFTKATKTLKAIEDSIAADQGAKYRQTLEKVIPHIGDAYRGEDSPFRSHLGASVIGDECARAIWYGFRWFTKPQFGGRILRLFNRGHLEEARFIAILLSIGVQIYQQDENGKQFRISAVGGHFGGSGDGVAVGIPDLPAGQPCVTEYKTHNDKSFQKLKKEGVRAAKFEHYVQMQIYMRKMGIPAALYMAVNKNDDEIWAEIITLSSPLADQYIDRGRQIIILQEAPKRLSESPGWFACSWCDHKPVCHMGKAPERTCRSCVYSVAKEDGKWYCLNAEDGGRELTSSMQLETCPAYEAIK